MRTILKINYEMISEAAKSKKLTAEKIGELIDRNPTSVKRALSGPYEPFPTTLKKICDVLGLSIADVFIEVPF